MRCGATGMRAATQTALHTGRPASSEPPVHAYARTAAQPRRMQPRRTVEEAKEHSAECVRQLQCRCDVDVLDTCTKSGGEGGTA